MDPISGADELPTAVLATTVDPQGVTVTMLHAGRPLVVAFDYEGFVHLRVPETKDAPIVTLPWSELIRIWSEAAGRRIQPVGARA